MEFFFHGGGVGAGLCLHSGLVFFNCFIISQNALSSVAGQLVYNAFYTRYQVSLYLWLIKFITKSSYGAYYVHVVAQSDWFFYQLL